MATVLIDDSDGPDLAETLAKRDALVYALAQKLRVPLVVTLGGGYGRDIDASVRGHAQVFRGLISAYG
jgi:acetoin utilization deacetylase AcuC-like enzyme